MSKQPSGFLEAEDKAAKEVAAAGTDSDMASVADSTDEETKLRREVRAIKKAEKQKRKEKKAAKKAKKAKKSKKAKYDSSDEDWKRAIASVYEKIFICDD